MVEIAASIADVCKPKICEEGGGGLLLPLIESEHEWPNGLRVVLYILGLGWVFMGVAIVADVFMGAIEQITSQKKKIYNPKTQKTVTVLIWNETVANLTLMALGSSAPEILLSLIETLGNDFYAGELGPSTIVGSAAFNLFCIIAVCISAIPEGEVRFIKDMTVFFITASFSLAAYLWLYLIVGFITPDVIDVWEGVLTFIFFPVLILLAYMADRGYFSVAFEEGETVAHVVLEDMSPQEIAELQMQIMQEHNGELTTEEVAKIIHQRTHLEHKSRAHYRAAGMRGFIGGHRPSDEIFPVIDLSKVVPIEDTCEEDDGTTVVLNFSSKKFVVAENIGTLSLRVEMSIIGELSVLTNVVTVKYKTRDGSAQASIDYEHVEGTIEFAPGDSEGKVNITIIDDDAFECAEEFFIDLYDARTEVADCKAVLGPHSTAAICILDDDRPGFIAFKDETFTVHEGLQEKEVQVQVVRKGGCVGKVCVEYMTEDDTAEAGRDYCPASGTLEFSNGQAAAEIPITILPRGHYDTKDKFNVLMSSPTGGAVFEKKEGVEGNKVTVIIEAANEKACVDGVATLLQDLERSKSKHSSWRDQFVEAIQVEGDDDEPPGISAYMMHFMTVPWKVLFASIPPAEMMNGWLCFTCSLAWIGAVTAIIGDLAGLVGCTVGLPDAVTAITFVALGTSLPDTFASKLAATQDPHADASIGNVTGSNSVNVFLGIGLSWAVGAIYWSSKGYDSEWAARYPTVVANYPDGGKFVVIGGDLGFSLGIFFACAICCFVVLGFRRVYCGGELGGPQPAKSASSAFLVGLWLVYVSLSSWKVMDSLKGAPCA